jgi:hypothetical protein
MEVNEHSVRDKTSCKPESSFQNSPKSGRHN